jgi:hypothetical protein
VLRRERMTLESLGFLSSEQGEHADEGLEMVRS